MGKPTPTSADAADLVKQGPLASNGDTTPPADVRGTFNIFLTGTGSAILESSFDGGASYVPCKNLGADVVFVAPCREQVESREVGLLHRLRRTSAAAANLYGRISQ